MKTCRVWLKRRDQYQSGNHETNDKNKPFIHNFLCMTMFFLSIDNQCYYFTNNEKRSATANAG